MSRRPAIVIVAPHAACRDGTGRICDTNAATLARALSKQLPFARVFVNTDVLRSTHDMNRHESRGTDFRRNLHDYMNGNAITMVIEAHSMPRGSYDMDRDIVLLHVDEEDRLRPLANALSRQFRTELLPADPVINDIQLEARKQHGVALAFLVEIAEDLTAEQVEQAAKIIATWAAS